MRSAVGVVVVGMGRSGTSAVTGMFASAGFFVGRDDDLMPATESNPVGHWENMDIWRANEEILRRLGGSWFDPPSAAALLAAQEWAGPLLSFEVERLVEHAGDAPIAIKDPRIGVMMKLWHPIIADYLHPVIVIRDPVEIARSLHHRDGTPSAFALAAWELHMTTLLDSLDGQIVTVAPYAHLIENDRLRPLVIEKAALHLEPSRASGVRPADASGALELAFRHNRAAVSDHHEQLTNRQLDLWRLLSSLPAGDQVIDVPTVLRRRSAAARSGVRSETQRAQLVHDLVTERTRYAALGTQLVSEREKAATLAAQLASEEERVASLVAALAGEQQHRMSLGEELSTEHQRANAAVAAHLRAEGWLAAIQSSVSWRVTAPLRSFKSTLRRRGTRKRYFHELSWLGEPVVSATSSIPGRRRGPLRSLKHVRPSSIRTCPCEIHVPISPTPAFLTRIHYLVWSLRLFGGALADCPVVVTVGGDEPMDLARAHPWSRSLGVEWRWLDDPLWRRHGIFATALQRFCYEIEAPNALLLDSDTLFVRPIDDLLVEMGGSQAIAGVIAHVSPFIGYDGEQGLWQQIFHGAGLGNPSLTSEHSGWQVLEFDAARRYCPPYFNLGVLFARRDVFGKLGESIYSEMEIVERIHPTPFRCQLALTMAIIRSGTKWRELPLRFNLPNIAQYLPRHLAELADARIIHYLKDEEFNRAEDFASVESVGALLARDGLNPINTTLREALRQVHERVLAEV